METGFKVGEAMTEKPIAIGIDTTLNKCAETMKKNHVGALLVKDQEKLVGIITEQDIVRKAVAKDVLPSKIKVSEVMEKKLITTSPDEDIFEALKLMRDYNIRHLPVIHQGGLVGLVTLKDILKIEPDLFDLLIEKFELKEEEKKPIYTMREREGTCQSCGEYSEDLLNLEGIMTCENCR